MGSTAIAETIRPPDNGRQSWDQYFLGLATEISKRSTCARLKVGAIFTRDSRILATGYNGSLPGRPHCDDVGCLMHEGHCIASVHAENNAICQAAQHGISLKDSWLYVTHLPCLGCYVNVLAAGTARVYFGEMYRHSDLSIYQKLQGMSRLEQIK
jgi:dCMP deaminase